MVNTKGVTVLGTTEAHCRAPIGKFRACGKTSSVIYQIGPDVLTVDLAFMFCKESKNDYAEGVQIFNDRGEECIVRGKVSLPQKPEEDDGFGGQPYCNEVPPVQWQTVE